MGIPGWLQWLSDAGLFVLGLLVFVFIIVAFIQLAAGASWWPWKKGG